MDDNGKIDDMKEVGGNGRNLRKRKHMCLSTTKLTWHELGSNRRPQAPEVSALVLTHRGPNIFVFKNLQI